jgi:hypothetical protein
VITERRSEFPYLVAAECDNPTATYLSPAQRREMQQNTQAGRSEAAARIPETAEQQKPAHSLWILTDDPGVVKWIKGEKRSAHAEVLTASLEQTLYDYVKANVCVRLEQATTTAPASEPAERE